jgi:hypothetical protein
MDLKILLKDYDVKPVTSASEVLIELDTGCYDLLIYDLHNLSESADVLEKLFNFLPIILLSPYPPALVNNFTRYYSDILTLPYDPVVLINKVKNNLFALPSGNLSVYVRRYT